MSKGARGLMLRSMQTAQQGRAGRAGGKEGKRALAERARADVVEAHELAGKGEHGAAAAAFASLGAIAQDRGLHGVASFFAVQAAMSHVALEEGKAALEAARAGVGYAELVPEKRRVARPFARLHAALAAIDAEAASALATEVRERFGLKSLPSVGEGAAPNRAQRRSLPRACACCGAATADLALRFEDDGTVDCPRCGEPLG